jgi:glycosyl transferase family 25
MQQIPIFLINLDRSSDRLEDISRRLSAMNLTFERIPAVNSDDIPDEQAERLLSYRSGHLPLGKGEMGCFLSHRKVWKEIIDRGLTWAFVAEDDLHLAHAEAFFENSNWLPTDAHIVKAETARQRVFLSTELHSEVAGHELRLLKSYHGGSAGYFVSAKGAALLLKESETRCDALDHVLFHHWIGIVQQMTVYQMDPAICVQDYLLGGPQKRGFRSTLNSDRKDSRRTQGIKGKPKGLAKIWRELSRPFTRLARKVSDALRNFLGTARIKFIPYAGEQKP